MGLLWNRENDAIANNRLMAHRAMDFAPAALILITGVATVTNIVSIAGPAERGEVQYYSPDAVNEMGTIRIFVAVFFANAIRFKK